MTPSGKTAGVPRQAEQTHQGGSARADVTPSRRRKKIQHRCYRNKILPRQKQQGPPEKVGCSPDPPRLVTRGERERERERRIGRRSKEGNTKWEAQE